MRVSGDVGCRPRRVWEAGLMDLAPDLIDHATLGVAPWGRNGWGAALLMRDVSGDLPELGDEPISRGTPRRVPRRHRRAVGAVVGLAG